MDSTDKGVSRPFTVFSLCSFLNLFALRNKTITIMIMIRAQTIVVQINMGSALIVLNIISKDYTT